MSMNSSVSLNVSTRKELYGRRIIKRYKKKSGKIEANTEIRAIVCDAHYSDDLGPNHQPMLIITCEHEETSLILHWAIPTKIDSPEDWDDYPYTIRFDRLDVDANDLQGIKIGGGFNPVEEGELMELLKDHSQKYDQVFAKGAVR
jgi:hypothetical protein